MVGAWESAGWIELALVDGQGVPHSSSPPGPSSKMATPDKTSQASFRTTHSDIITLMFGLAS